MEMQVHQHFLPLYTMFSFGLLWEAPSIQSHRVGECVDFHFIVVHKSLAQAVRFCSHLGCCLLQCGVSVRRPNLWQDPQVYYSCWACLDIKVQIKNLYQYLKNIWPKSWYGLNLPCHTNISNWGLRNLFLKRRKGPNSCVNWCRSDVC